MIRIAVFFAFALLAATAVHATQSAPQSLDKQDGNQVTIRGIISVQKKNTIKEVYFIDTYKIRGLGKDKLRPWIGKRVVIVGEFRVLSGEVVIYARSIEKAPKPGEQDD